MGSPKVAQSVTTGAVSDGDLKFKPPVDKDMTASDTPLNFASREAVVGYCGVTFDPNELWCPVKKAHMWSTDLERSRWPTSLC